MFHLHGSNHQHSPCLLTHQHCHSSSSPTPDPHFLSNSLCVCFLFFCQSLGANWNLLWFHLPFPKADEVELIFYMLVLYRCLSFFFYIIPVYFLGPFFRFVASLSIDLEKSVLSSVKESFLRYMFFANIFSSSLVFCCMNICKSFFSRPMILIFFFFKAGNLYSNRGNDDIKILGAK